MNARFREEAVKRDCDDMATRVSLSVLIATYKRPAGLRRVLTKVVPQVRGRPDREIVVVNDGSDNAEYAAVVAEFREDVVYDAAPENAGVGVTRNRAAALAKHDFIVYTDDDCEPPEWWLDWLTALLRLHPEIDVVAGTTRPLWSEGRPFIERVQAHYRLLPHPWRADELNIFVTANTAMRRSLFVELGGFAVRERFLRAGEDTELAVRFARHNARIVVDPNWYVRHEVGGRLRDQMRRYFGYGYANVWITRLTTAPKLHAQFALARRRFYPRSFLRSLRLMASRSAGFSRNPLSRYLSVLIAAIIQSSHYRGCARAARDMRRELRAKAQP